MRFVFIFALLLSFLSSCIDEDLSKCKSKDVSVGISYVLGKDAHYDVNFAEEPLFLSLHYGFWTENFALYDESELDRAEFPDDMYFPFVLPRDNYTHIAAANAVSASSYRLSAFGGSPASVALSGSFIAPDTMAAFSSPAFCGRVDIAGDTCNCSSHLYVVPMRPVVSRLLLTVNHGADIRDLRVVVGGTKAGYMLYDTLFRSDAALHVLAGKEVMNQISASQAQFSFYTFPVSVDVSEGAGQQPLAPAARAGSPSKWYIVFFAERAGKTVMNRYTVEEELYAGMVYDRTFEFYTDTNGVEAGVEVDLDWKPGGHHDEEI
ncbi:MAG: hypothetical protein ACI3Z7_03735 [Candidatus Aphodosoma sp.]